MTDNIYTDTIVAPATIPGTGAISIVRLSGPKVFSIVDAVVRLNTGTVSGASAYSIHYATVSKADGSLLDEVLVSVFKTPHSYTGEDSVEISTHASAYIVTELIRLLVASGARMAEPGEFTRRAFLNGKMDLSQAEAIADVISSSTEAAHRVAMNQLKGSYSGELDSLRAQLLEMASLLELELDFSEEDVEFADREKLIGLIDATKSHVDKLADSFHDGNLIKKGIPVAIVGAANAGKSTLLNALIGEERAIVTDIPGTTRDTVEETVTLGGMLFRFIDTAGIRASEDTVEMLGIERSFKAISQAEVVLCLFDGTSSESDLLNNFEKLLPVVKDEAKKCYFLLNKCDIQHENTVNKNVTIINKFVSRLDLKANILRISAKSKIGLQELTDELLESQKDLTANEDSTFVTNERHYNALLQASSALQNCRTSLLAGIPSDLVAEELRTAIRSINSILGKELDSEQILHNIFSKHCIGK